MTRRKLLQLIEEGENLHVEFKQRFSTHEKIAKEMIAFANTKGGVIVFGVDDDKSIYGVQSEKSEATLVLETAERYCEPPINLIISYFDIENRELVVAEIEESQTKPHRIQDFEKKFDINEASVYVRVQDKSVLASKEMIKVLQNQIENKELKNYVVGKNEKIVFTYLENNETINVRELSRLANISNRRASRTLINLVRANLLIIHTKDNGEDYFTYSG